MIRRKASDICECCCKTLLNCTCEDLAPKGADAAYERERERRSGLLGWPDDADKHATGGKPDV